MISADLIDKLKTGNVELKLRAGKYYNPVHLTIEDNRIFFHFGYNKPLIDLIKTRFEDRRYHGYMDGDGRKLWSIPINFRNLWQLEVLRGKYGINPYEIWDESNWINFKIKEHCNAKNINPYTHQIEMVNHGLNTHWFIWAAEMGTGKTLAAIILVEMCPYNDCMWIGPRSALIAARSEFRRWNARFFPECMTYDALRTKIKNWNRESPPRILILDESSLCKTPTAQRSRAAKYVADLMRSTYFHECYIGLLSGAPSPKAPPDWWMQCEIACPGFLSEGSYRTFRDRLGFFVKEESASGTGVFDKLVRWKSDEKFCKICGELEENHLDHKFEPCINEVAKCKIRMKGLVKVWLKEDCLDLPPKRYEVITLEPSIKILQIAKAIVETTSRAADALIKLRTISDGFIYTEQRTNKFKTCPGCKGEKNILEWQDRDAEYDILMPEEIEQRVRFIWSEEDEIIDKRPANIEEVQVPCYMCDGTGQIEIFERITEEIDCPKIDLLIDILEQHEEIGRLNVYAGFQGSVDRIIKIAHQQGWTTIRADGRGWEGSTADGIQLGLSADNLIHSFQNDKETYPKMVFVGQPGAAGMGITLTASPSTFYYSNDFNPQSRMQSEDRGHRIGMDLIRGGRIIDCIHLPSDKKIIESLRQSKNLQKMSMTGLKEIFNVND